MNRNKNRATVMEKRKTYMFKAATLLLVFVFFVLMEMILRISGYGSDYPLFIPVENDTSWVQMNPKIAKKYFGDSENATVGFQEWLQKNKDSDRFRVFVLGASTAVGYPYKKNGSFHRWLQYALNTTFPDKKIEIINLSLTAVNSYTLLDFTKQLVDYQPDAILIYAGHNEYYGALGVGASNSMIRNPRWVNMALQMKSLRLVQLVESGIAAVVHISDPDREKRTTLMEKMVADRKIPYGSKKYQQGIQQFNYNFEKIAEHTQNWGIPVFVSTLVSNEKGLKPFVGIGENPKTSAGHYFDLANQALGKRDLVEAKNNFVLAKEYDQLRFRAPEAINDGIKELSRTYSHIFLVDTKSRFESLSDDGIIGNSFLWEHVHPNLEGYSLLAHSFYEVILDSGLLGTAHGPVLSWSALKRQMPITRVDEAAGMYEILQLKEGWPFYEPMPEIRKDSLSVAERLGGKWAVNLIGWDEAMQTLYGHYQREGKVEMGLKVAEGLTLEYPHEARFRIESALLALRLKKMEKAAHHFKKALELDPSRENSKKIAVTLVEAEAYKASLPYLEYAMQKSNGDNQLRGIYGAVKRIVKDGTADSVALAESYILLRKRTKAVEVLKNILDKDPDNGKALLLLENIN